VTVCAPASVSFCACGSSRRCAMKTSIMRSSRLAPARSASVLRATANTSAWVRTESLVTEFRSLLGQGLGQLRVQLLRLLPR
jgi:hypothetical protein